MNDNNYQKKEGTKMLNKNNCNFNKNIYKKVVISFLELTVILLASLILSFVFLDSLLFSFVLGVGFVASVVVTFILVRTKNESLPLAINNI